MSTSSIDRIRTPSSPEFFERYASRGAPVVLVDAMDSWVCRRRWTDDYLNDKLARRTFLVNRSADGAFGIFSSRMRDLDGYVLVGFRELLDLMSRSDPEAPIHYMQQKPIHEAFPELTGDLDYVDFLDRRELRDVNLWWSQQGSHIPLHFDTFDNLLAQVRGSKRIRLLAPDQTPFLYPGRDGAEFASQVDLDRIDLAAFPLAARAEIHAELVLSEGELLYLPAFYWHHVVTHDRVSLSLNYWYHYVHGSPREPLVAARDLVRLGVRALGSLPPAQRRLAARDLLRAANELLTDTPR